MKLSEIFDRDGRTRLQVKFLLNVGTPEMLAGYLWEHGCSKSQIEYGPQFQGDFSRLGKKGRLEDVQLATDVAIRLLREQKKVENKYCGIILDRSSFYGNNKHAPSDSAAAAYRLEVRALLEAVTEQFSAILNPAADQQASPTKKAVAGM